MKEKSNQVDELYYSSIVTADIVRKILEVLDEFRETIAGCRFELKRLQGMFKLQQRILPDGYELIESTKRENSWYAIWELLGHISCELVAEVASAQSRASCVADNVDKIWALIDILQYEEVLSIGREVLSYAKNHIVGA